MRAVFRSQSAVASPRRKRVGSSAQSLTLHESCLHAYKRCKSVYEEESGPSAPNTTMIVPTSESNGESSPPSYESVASHIDTTSTHGGGKSGATHAAKDAAAPPAASDVSTPPTTNALPISPIGMPLSYYRLTLASVVLTSVALVLSLTDRGWFSVWSVPSAALATLAFHGTLLHLVRREHGAGARRAPRYASIANAACACFLVAVWAAAFGLTATFVGIGFYDMGAGYNPPGVHTSIVALAMQLILVFAETVVMGVYVRFGVRARRAWRQKAKDGKDAPA